MTAKNLYERKLNRVKSDKEFVDYLVEIYTTDDDGNEHPELLKLHGRNNRVSFNTDGNNDWTQDDWMVLVCNKCGEHSAVDGYGLSVTWDERYCFGCGEEFTQIAEYKNIEW